MNFKQLETYRTGYLNKTIEGDTLFQACRIFIKKLIPEDTADRDDIVQSVTWTAWEKFNTLPANTPFGPWLVRVTRNRIIDERRKHTTRLKYENKNFTDVTPALTLTEQSTLREIAGEYLPLVDMLLLGNTFKEAAQMLGITVGMAKQQLDRLREEQTANV
jgi:DNA-directed RNA polymerase specialized sigma24 family protein